MKNEICLNEKEIEIVEQLSQSVASSRQNKASTIKFKSVIGAFVAMGWGRDSVKISFSELRNQYGIQNRWSCLRDIFLTLKSKGFFDGAKTKESNEYYFNHDKLNDCLEILNFDEIQCLNLFLSQFVDSKEFATGEFSYTKSKNQYLSRRYHPAQSLKREVRSHLLAHYGYVYQVDVKSTYPTLLSQLVEEAREAAPVLPETPCLDAIARDPDGVRQRLALALGSSVGLVKAVLSALLFGARLSAHVGAVRDACAGDDELLLRVRNCAFFVAYEKELKLLNKLLPGVVRRLMENRMNWMECPNNKFVHSMCESLEGKVIDTICEFIKNLGGKTFLIHDCVATDYDISEFVMLIEEFVLEKTSYRIKLTFSINDVFG